MGSKSTRAIHKEGAKLMRLIDTNCPKCGDVNHTQSEGLKNKYTVVCEYCQEVYDVIMEISWYISRHTKKEEK